MNALMDQAEFEYQQRKAKHDKANALAEHLIEVRNLDRRTLPPFGSGDHHLYDWLNRMGYSWDGEHWNDDNKANRVEAAGDALHNALCVLTRDDFLRAFIRYNDPKAFEQAVKAIEQWENRHRPW